MARDTLENAWEVFRRENECFLESEAKIVQKNSVFRDSDRIFESEAKIVEKTSDFQQPRQKYSRKMMVVLSRMPRNQSSTVRVLCWGNS